MVRWAVSLSEDPAVSWAPITSAVSKKQNQTILQTKSVSAEKKLRCVRIM